MTIRYIIGRAGRGTDRLAMMEIGRELNQDSDQRLYLLVPEQYTLQAERNLIKELNLPGIMRAEVISFNRLLYRVLNETGSHRHVLINEQGRSMVIKKVIHNVASDLTVYQQACHQQGFAEEIAGILTGFKQYDLDPAALRERVNEIREDSLRLKMQDITLIFTAYTDYMADHYLDMEDQLNLFIEKLDDSKLLTNCQIWIDKFDHFPPQDLRIIEKLMLQAKETTICLIDDLHPGRDRDLFKMSKRCYKNIHALAVQHGLEEKIIDLAAESHRWLAMPRTASLKHLEQELYAYPYRSFQAETDAIALFAAANPNSEVEHVAGSIIRLVQERGWRWRDIAVLGNNMETYGPMIARVFNEYRIPFFLDTKSSIDNHPLIKMILASLAIVTRGYRPEDILMLLKCGFTDLSEDQSEEMENYLLAYGIRGKLWREDFTRGQDEIGAEQLTALNILRRQLFMPLQTLEKALAGVQTGQEIGQALYHYLQVLQMEAKLQDWTEQLRGDGLFEYALQNAQIWNIVMQTLDQLVEILGNQKIRAQEFANLLETGFASISIGIIPTTVDQVVIGSLHRSKSHAFKAVLIMGVNDDILPAGKASQMLLTENEIMLLQTCQIDLDWDQATQSLTEQVTIYQAFNQAEAFLSLSYAIADQEGRALRPSVLINRMKSLFPKIIVSSDLVRDRQIELEQVVTSSGSYKYLIEKLRLYLDGEEICDFWWDVYAWYENNSAWDQRRHELLDALFYQNQITGQEPGSASKLYPSPFYSSVSRLEQFAACPFAHFVRYGLRPQERKEFAVRMPEVGSLLHEGLAIFACELDKQGIDWRTLDHAACNELVDKIMTEQLTVHNNGIMMSSSRYRYLARRLQRITRRAVWTLTEHIQRGDFEPYLYEARFGSDGAFPPIKIELNQQQTFYLEGRIDRIDILETGEHTYCKIIDYKSSDRQLSLSELYYGLNLQLFVYLLAVLQSNPTAHQADPASHKYRPAGLFYFKIDDPLINTTAMEPAEIEASIRKKLRMKGLVLKDVALVRAMDNAVQGDSDILPVGIKNDGEFNSRSNVLTLEDFSLLLRYLQDLLQQLGTRMISGHICIEPVKTAQGKACDYCLYHSICQFDKLFTANRYKLIKPEKDAAILEKIKQLRRNDTNE